MSLKQKVDAPGVRDDNSVRDAVVKKYLKDSDSIWIVANIKRAVDDRTAKEMLGKHCFSHPIHTKMFYLFFLFFIILLFRGKHSPATAYGTIPFLSGNNEM